MWKPMAFAAVLALAACDARVGGASHRGPSYTLDVFARDTEQIYLVSLDEAHVAAARVVDHQSSLIDAAEARTLLERRQAEFRQPEHQAVALRAGNLSLDVRGGARDGEGEDSGDAHVEINAGGQAISIDAQDSGDDNGRARVHITGADADAARHFINQAEDLSADVKTQMLHALDL